MDVVVVLRVGVCADDAQFCVGLAVIQSVGPSDRNAELHAWRIIMNSQMYCSILKEKMLPSLRALGRRALFQHDNDPKHTSKATVGFLKKNRVKVIQCPSMSPDLNPIEHLWGIQKRQVEHHSPSSIQSLKEVILEEWKKIDLAKCRHFCVH